MATKKNPSTPPPPPPPLIGKIGPYTVFMTPPKPLFESESPKKVVPPPHQFDKSISTHDSPVSGFFRNTVSKIQSAHSSLDDRLSRWFGLDQSKYQWALDDYYQSKGVLGKDEAKSKDMSSRMQTVATESA